MPKTEADFPLDGMVAFELLRLASIYHEQANACRKEGAPLASCVMLGATVEAMLIVLINLFRHEARPVAIEKKLKLEDLLRWDFGRLFGAVQRAILAPVDKAGDSRSSCYKLNRFCLSNWPLATYVITLNMSGGALAHCLHVLGVQSGLKRSKPKPGRPNAWSVPRCQFR